MKKNFLTIAVCLAITASSALAQPNTTSATKADIKKPATSIMKQEKPLNKEDYKKIFEQKRKQKREFMYKFLELSAEQKTKAEALDEKAKAEAKPLFDKARAESKKLKDLKAQKASAFAIWRQEFAINTARNDFKKHMEKSKNDFESILTQEQKTKLKEMEKFRKEQMPKGKGHYKKMGPPHGMGPRGIMRPEMGPPPHDPMGPPPPPFEED